MSEFEIEDNKIATSTMVGMVKAEPVSILIVPSVEKEGKYTSWTGSYDLRYKGVANEQAYPFIAHLLRVIAHKLDGKGVQ